MGTPTDRELALQAEVQQRQKRLATSERSEPEGTQVGEALKAAHDEAVAQRNRLQAVLEALPVGVALIDAQGGTTECNAAFEQVWGGPRPATRSVEDYAAYKAWWADTGNPVRPEEWASARAIYRGETVINQEMWIERFDGTRAFILNSAAPIRDAQGRIYGSAVAIRDVTKTKESEESLRESEARFRALVMAASDVVYRVSPDWAEMRSLRGQEFLADTEMPTRAWIDKYIPPDDQAHVKAAIEEAIRTKTKFELEHRVIRVDGTLGWTFSRAIPVLDGSDAIVEWFGIASDITWRKQAEETVRDSEERLRLAQRAARIGAFEWSVETGVNRWTPELEAMYGLPPGGFQGTQEAWEQLVHPDDLATALESVDRAFQTGMPVEAEWRVIWPDGSEHWLTGRFQALKNAEGRPVRLAGVNIDVTDRKRYEEALRESEEQLASIYNTVDDVIFYLAVEPEGQFRFVSVNAAFLRITGLSREAVVGKLEKDVISEASLSILSEKYTQAIQEKTIVSWEQTSDFPTGRLTGVASIAPVFDGNGACTHLVGSVHDITERKRAEATLRESEERFRTVADTAPVMIWMAGLDKLCTFFNTPWLEFTGRTMEQELGNGWADGVHPDDRDRCLTTYVSSFDAHRSFEIECRLRRADGEYRWLLDNGTPRYREGEFAGFIGSCLDITEKRRAEEELRSNQAQLVDSQRLARVGSWEMDVATGKTRWSDEWYRIFGQSKDVRTDFQTFLSSVHPKDRATVIEAEKMSHSAGGPSEVEFRIIRPDGEVRFIRSIVEAIKNDEGALVRLAGASQDITEQVKATERLRESEARLKNAERLSHVGNWDWDIKTNHLSWSAEFFRIIGQPPDRETSYDGFLQIVAPADKQRVEQWLSDCVAKKKGSLIEFRMVRPDDDARTVVFTSEVFLDEDGSPERMFGACQDVTDAKRAQEEAFARQKLESLGTLASGIAHDFNNLLGAVLAQTELAIAELPTGSQADEQLSEIRDIAIRGSEIVRQLMVYAGKEGDVLERIDVSKAVEGMLGLLKVSVSNHAILVTDLRENLPAVKARAAQLRQIVMNLVVNARDAMKGPKGVINVATRPVTVGHDSAGETWAGLAEGEYVQLEVSDNGKGMSPETQAKVFDPFFTTKSAGHGLGLAVVDGIVRSLDGAIRVVSELDKGTTFQILLPCAGSADATSTTGDGKDEVARSSPAATVLVVEDEHPLREALTKMLGKAGFGVLEVDNGSDAIELLREKADEIDVILLDMTIPGAPSHDVLANAVQFRPNMKVILTSAYSEEMAKSRLNGPQVCSFVRKPFQFEALIKILREILSSEETF